MREIESQAIAAQQQISLVRTQVASKQREMRMAQLTRGEIASLPQDTAVYEGVGKMCVVFFSFLLACLLSPPFACVYSTCSPC